MKYGELLIETKEYDMLMQIITMAHHKKDPTYKASMDKLRQELKSARIVPIEKMPDDVVRFNTFVTIQDPFDNIPVYQIVTPEKSNLTEHKVSVLAPMGLALFGYAQDDEIMWQFPTGMQAIRILKVEQYPPVNTNAI